MARLRYVKSADELAKSGSPEFMESSVRSVRCVYETDPELVAAVLPDPLEPAERPEVCVTFSHVAMHISPEFTFEIGSTIFGVRATYEGSEGIYLITMPMTTEAAVVGGRETFGEPKKIADIDFQKEGDRVSFSVSRMGLTYLSVAGTIGDSLGPRDFTEHAFCFKAFPSCDKGRAFDSDPLLVRLEWNHRQTAVHAMKGELVLGESPLDPVADLPVRKLVTLEYEEGTTESNGTVLTSVPGDALLPFLHGRYDEPSVQGIEVSAE